jgi:hypothetical protein
MFNQKVNYNISDNPDYLNYSYGAPYVKAVDVHNCGTTVSKYTKDAKCNGLPLQTWCSKNAAVESFAMRPIVNSKEYFDNIKNYLATIVYTDSIDLKRSKLSSEKYQLLEDYGIEPSSSFLNAINIEVTNKIMYLMASSTNEIKMFNEYNPLCEGLVVTDIDLVTYKSVSNKNHYYHTIIFSVVNTTRYNTITFKANAYQDTTPMMANWNKAIGEVTSSQNITPGINNVNSLVYISYIDLLNNTSCVTGQESDCEFKGYSLVNNSFSQLLNDNLLAQPTSINWLNPNNLTNNNYTNLGNYAEDGRIQITDSGPSNFTNLIKDLGY